MDVISHYPSIDIDFAVKKCIEIICESEVVFCEINARELGHLVRQYYDSDYLDHYDLSRLCPTKSSQRGRPHTITSAVNKSTTTECRAFLTQDPEGNNRAKWMIARTIGASVITTLKNQKVDFNKKLYLQVQGGAENFSNS